MRKIVLIVAGGKGLRMGNVLPKQFIPIAGKPVLMHTLETFYNWDMTAELVLVIPEEHQDYWKMLCKEIGCKVPHKIVNGGKTRFHSVLNGLDFIDHEILKGTQNDSTFIAIHDGVRPFVTSEVIQTCFSVAESFGAVVPTIPIFDSLREIKGEYSYPVDRNRFVAVQTPQVFNYKIIKKAYQQSYRLEFTDDASVVEAAGYQVQIVPGNRENIKLTTPVDMDLAEILLKTKI